MSTRVALMAAVLVTALLVSSVIAPAMAIGAVVPDLVLLSVIAFGLADGPASGTRYGFVAGLVVDLLAGPQQLVGLGAFVLLLVGYLAGAGRRYLGGDTLVAQMILAGGVTAVGIGAYALLGLLLGQAVPSAPAATRNALGLGLYHALLVPLLVRPLVRLAERHPGTVQAEGR